MDRTPSSEFFQELKGRYPPVPKNKNLSPRYENHDINENENIHLNGYYNGVKNDSNKKSESNNDTNGKSSNDNSLRYRGKGGNRNKNSNNKHSNDKLNNENFDRFNSKEVSGNNHYIFENYKRPRTARCLIKIKHICLLVISFLGIFCPTFAFGFCTFPLYIISSRIHLGSWTWCVKRQWMLIKAMYKCQGLLGILLPSALIYLWQSFSLISLLFDYLFFYNFRKCKVVKPIFVVGLPRSGTTYIHRQLTKQLPIDTTNDETPTKRNDKLKQKKSNQKKKFTNSTIVTHRLWEILFPSLCLRTILKPFVLIIDRFIKYYKGYDILHGAYDYQINGEAHEEALMSMHGLCGDFYIEPHCVGWYWDLQMEFLGVNDRKHWDVHIKFLHSLLKRQIYWTGNNRIIAKSPSMTWCLKNVIEEFPDCKILLLVRDPKEMLCSNLSLLYTSWSALYNKTLLQAFWNDAKKNLIWRRIEQWNRVLNVIKELDYKFEDDTFDKENKPILVMRYTDIKNNLLRIMIKAYNHCNLDLNETLIDYYKEATNKQRKHKRKHEVKPLSFYRIPKQPVTDAFKDVTSYFKSKTHWE